MPIAATKPAVALERPRRIFFSASACKPLSALVLITLTLVLYNPVARNGFVNFDDDRYVTKNQNISAGLHWSTVRWAFTSIEQGNWHPLTWLSHALDFQLFYLNAAGHHYSSVLLHAANALLLFLILQWFTGSIARSFWVAALFAVHPLNVESVAWVAERKTVLSLFFCLLAVAVYGWYVRKPGIARYLPMVILFAMSLMSKPMAVTFPFILLLLDYWPLGRMRVDSKVAYSSNPLSAAPWPLWQLCLEKMPLLALSAASAVITMIAQRAEGAVVAVSAERSLLLRLENVVVCYALYIKKAVWPSHLAVLYPYPHALAAWKVALSLLFLVTVTIVVLKYREHRYLVVGWFWYLGTMVPMIGFIQVGNQAMADRYAYLPMIGLFIIVVWAAVDCVRTLPLLEQSVTAKLLAIAAIFLLIGFSAITRMQLNYWRDDFTLWSHTLAVTNNNFVAENNFAEALMKQGRSDEAIAHFRTAAALEPADAVSQLNLGIFSHEHGDLRQAAARYETVLRLATDAQIRASAYANLGTVYFAQGEYTKARQYFYSAMNLKQVFPIAFLDMGLMAERTAQSAADWNQAAAYYAAFVNTAPSDVAYLLLANALRHSAQDAGANRAYQQAVQLSQNLSQAQQTAANLTNK
jgi:tetratricopeptide (TPR) repeat protein